MKRISLIILLLTGIAFSYTAQAQTDISPERKRAIDSLAMEKIRDLGKYISIIGNKQTPFSEAKRVIDRTLELFVEDAQMGVSSLSREEVTYYGIKEYLENDRKVGCINFSSDTLKNEFSYDEQEIFAFLSRFMGDGTNIDLEKVRKMVESNRTPVDLILISDMEIENLDETVNFLGTLKNRNRVYIFKIDQSYQASTPLLPEGVSLFTITQPSDIAKIVLRESRDWF